MLANQVVEIAAAYHAAPIYDPRAARAWCLLANDSLRRAAELRDKLAIWETNNPEPYANAAEMCADIRSGHFLVSRANCSHPLWTEADNVAFRIVHDIDGHYVSGGDFSWEGEIAACTTHAKRLSPIMRAALFTECIGQTACATVDHSFPVQKVAFLAI